MAKIAKRIYHMIRIAFVVVDGRRIYDVDACAEFYERVRNL